MPTEKISMPAAFERFAWMMVWSASTFASPSVMRTTRCGTATRAPLDGRNISVLALLSAAAMFVSPPLICRLAMALLRLSRSLCSFK
jgi:hypothetical protein